ncbi:MAG TPA: hypothetical protein VIK81_00325 [Patescibacteria group bacterium]
MGTKENSNSDWIELEIRNFIGRDIEQRESGDIFRGPIKRVEVRQEIDNKGNPYKMVTILTEWTAFKNSENEWMMYLESKDPEIGIHSCGFNLNELTPGLYKRLDDSYEFDISYVGSVKILPEGDNLKREDILPKS